MRGYDIYTKIYATFQAKLVAVNRAILIKKNSVRLQKAYLRYRVKHPQALSQREARCALNFISIWYNNAPADKLFYNFMEASKYKTDMKDGLRNFCFKVRQIRNQIKEFVSAIACRRMAYEHMFDLEIQAQIKAESAKQKKKSSLSEKANKLMRTQLSIDVMARALSRFSLLLAQIHMISHFIDSARHEKKSQTTIDNLTQRLNNRRGLCESLAEFMCDDKKMISDLIVAATRLDHGFQTRVFHKHVFAAILKKLVVKESLIKKLQDFIETQDRLFQEQNKILGEIYKGQKRVAQ